MVFVCGWPHIAATLKYISLWGISVEEDYINHQKYKFEYLRLASRISRLKRHGNVAPAELLLKALELGHLANIPDDELDSLLLNLTIQG